MSSIDNYLQAIQTAVYGEEVRDAIHDAIEECYTLSEEEAQEVSDLKSALIDYNSINLLSGKLNYESRTTQGVTYQWDADNTQCHVTGTASSVAVDYLIVSESNLPEGIVAGKTYIIKYHTTDNNIVLAIRSTVSGENQWTYIHQNCLYTIPIGCTGLIMRLQVASGKTVSGYASGIAILTAESNEDLALKKANVYDTFGELLSDRLIDIGAYAYTNGYYSSNDGGNGCYYISDTQISSYDSLMDSGLYAHYIAENGIVNAGAFGVCGSAMVNIDKVNNAIACAAGNDCNLVFPSDFTVGASIEITSALDGKHISFNGDVTYTGTVAAITLHNTKNIEVTGGKVTALTSGAAGVYYLQDGDYTIYNSNLHINFIEAYDGVRIHAKTWGVYECEVEVARINANRYGLLCRCLQESNTHTSFIGQMLYKICHIIAPNDYAIRMSAETSPSTITGAYIDSITFESSANGILLRGDCKMIKICNIRCLENDSFTWLINAEGALRYNEFSFTSPVRANKIHVSTTYGIASKPFVVNGGIASQTDYRFAEYLIASSSGIVYGSDGPSLIRHNGNDFEFGADSASYRLFNFLDNNQGSAVNYNLAGYFSPFGVDTIYVRQNKDDGSTIKVTVGATTVFDGANVADVGQTDYKLMAFYNSTSGSVEYITQKI